jgi:hypothetical protein
MRNSELKLFLYPIQFLKCNHIEAHLAPLSEAEGFSVRKRSKMPVHRDENSPADTGLKNPEIY